jgi:aldehyde:ferredoxin oxidoreductase
MLDEYYQLRDWDEFGCPAKKTLVKLGLGDYCLGRHSPGLVEEEM